MPTCPRCKTAFLDGEAHSCETRSHRAAFVFSGLVAIYAVLAYEAGSLFQPGAVVLYLVAVLAMGVGSIVAQLLQLIAG